MKRFPLSKISFLLAPAILGMQADTASASYEVKAGDTLSALSMTHYGTLEKWKEIFEANKDQIANPNLIYPGQRLRLIGDEKLNLVASNAPVKIAKGGKRSQEWRLLPLQNWEKFVFKTNPAIDPDGFDRRSRVAVRTADKTDAESTIASDRIPISGEIVGARSEFERVFLGEQVFIRADEQLQVGTVYSITAGPEKMTSDRDGRVGFSYDLTGKVRIIGVRDGLFIGTITAAYHQILRHQLLIPEVSAYNFPKPIPASSPLTAHIMVNDADSMSMLGEHRVIFLDVGTEDGVKTGMIFRHFLHEDPNSKENISSHDFLIESEIQVLSAKDKFSIGIIIQSRSHLRNNDEVVALTDLADFKKNQGLQTIIQDHTTVDNVDVLDQMDSTEGLGEKENQELRQLEKWSKPTPSDSGAPLLDADEIQRVGPSGEDHRTIGIGEEIAPNDGSDKTQAPAPEASESLDAPPTTAPEAAPLTPEETAPIPEAAPLAPEGTPAPAPEATPVPTTPAPAAPAPTPAPTAVPSVDSELDNP